MTHPGLPDAPDGKHPPQAPAPQPDQQWQQWQQQQWQQQYWQQPQQPWQQHWQGGAQPVGGPRVPRTRASLAVLPTTVGAALALVGSVALDWANGHPLRTIAELYTQGMAQGEVPDLLGNHIMLFYMRFGAILLVLVQAIHVIAWTAGGVRGKTSAMLILNTPGKGVAEGKLGSVNALFAGTAFIGLFTHFVVTWAITAGDIGDFSIGIWCTLAGTVLMGVGGAIGPRLAPVSAGR